MKNLHQISKNITDLDYAIIWWVQEYLGNKIQLLSSGIIRVYDTYTGKWTEVAYTPNDYEYIAMRWKEVGEPKYKIKI